VQKQRTLKVGVVYTCIMVAKRLASRYQSSLKSSVIGTSGVVTSRRNYVRKQSGCCLYLHNGGKKTGVTTVHARQEGVS
jgi:hypothetical protein